MTYEEYVEAIQKNQARLRAVEEELATAKEAKEAADQAYKTALLEDGLVEVAEIARQDATRRVMILQDKLALTEPTIDEKNKVIARAFHDCFNEVVATPYAGKIKELELKIQPLKRQMEDIEKEKSDILIEYRALWSKYTQAPAQFGIEESLAISSDNAKCLRIN